MSDAPASQVERWVEEVVIGYALCPFAAKPFSEGRVRWVTTDAAADGVIERFLDETETLVSTPDDELSTTLLVMTDPDIVDDFDHFLDLAYTCEELLAESGADSLVQIATFHPDYVFEGAAADDPANATNRAPFPVLHLLRVHEVEEAIARHGRIEELLERNQELMRRLASADG